MTSTAYVAGEQVGLIPEKPFLIGETLKMGIYLDIEAELKLIEDTRRELKAQGSTERNEKNVMKELGLKRLDVINTLIYLDIVPPSNICFYANLTHLLNMLLCKNE
jgi:hypothetical protein